MKVVPAIDLLEGRAVRLVEGKRDQATVYAERPWELAKGFMAAGLIHVVDLDAAFGSGDNRETIARLAAEGIPLQVGGGVRSVADVRALKDARYLVLGTAAVRAPALVERLCKDHPDRIVVAVDARDGRVAVEGWTRDSDVNARELAARAAAWGAAKLLYTDVRRDGTRRGPAVAETARLQAAVAIPVIASGGVGTLEDLKTLAAAGVRECVVGKALYEGAFTLAEALAC